MPHRNLDVPPEQPAEQDDAGEPEYVRAVRNAREFMQQGDFEFPYTMLHYIRHKEPQHLSESALALVPEMLADVSRSDFGAYRSLQDRKQVREKYITRDVDSSLRYKFDLLRELELPPQIQDEIAARALDRIFASLERILQGGGYDRGYRSSYERSPLEDNVQRACEILCNIPFQDQKLLLPLQERYRAFAAPLLAYTSDHNGMYYLQNLGRVLRLPWHTEYKAQHAPRAIELLMAHFPEVPVYDKTRVTRAILDLQEDSKAPVTPERMRGAIELLRDCIGHTDDTPRKLIIAFGIDRDTVTAIASEKAADYMRRHEHADPQDRSAWYPEQMVRVYGVPLRDMPLAERERARIAQEVLSVQAPQERQQAATAFVQRAEREHTAYLLPLALAGELTRSLESPDSGTIPELLQAFSREPATKQYADQAVDLLFADRQQHAPALSLRERGSQHLWMHLAQDPRYAKYADDALDAFVTQQGFDAAQMRKMWALSSNDRTAYSATMGTRVVQMKNVAAILALERKAPGAAGYFLRRWNMHMFSRYPVDVLAQIHAQEMAREGALGEPRTKPKKNLLVLFPASDWNGAFDTWPLIDHLAKEAAAKGFHMHIAEAGSRMAAMRALARCAHRHGQVDVCIFGGHASKDSLSLGPDAPGQIRTEHFTFDSDETGQPVPPEQLRRLRNYLSPNCRVLFKACSVGQQGGLAQAVSQAMNVTAIAAEVPTGMESVDLSQGTVRYRNAAQAREYQQPKPPPRNFLQRLWQYFRGRKGT